MQAEGSHRKQKARDFRNEVKIAGIFYNPLASLANSSAPA